MGIFSAIAANDFEEAALIGHIADMEMRDSIIEKLKINDCTLREACELAGYRFSSLDEQDLIYIYEKLEGRKNNAYYTNIDA